MSKEKRKTVFNIAVIGLSGTEQVSQQFFNFKLIVTYMLLRM